MTIFKARKRLCKGANVFRAARAWRRCQDISNEIPVIDLDEMIDFQSLKSRDICYFSQKLFELVKHGYTILTGGDPVENLNSNDGKRARHG